MGRKNKRINKDIDKNFEKFVKSFMSEQKDEIKKEPSYKVFMFMNNSKKDFNHHNYNNRLTNDKSYYNTKDNNNNNNFNDVDIKKRNKERLEYAKQQLELNNIKYHIIDEEKTFMECFRPSNNDWIKFYASSGYIIGYPDFRGIKTLIRLLTTETK